MKREVERLAALCLTSAMGVKFLVQGNEESAQMLIHDVTLILASVLVLERKVRCNDMCFISALSTYYEDGVANLGVVALCENASKVLEQSRGDAELIERDFLKIKTVCMTMVANIERLLVQRNYCRVVDHMAIERAIQSFKNQG